MQPLRSNQRKFSPPFIGLTYLVLILGCWSRSSIFKLLLWSTEYELRYDTGLPRANSLIRCCNCWPMRTGKSGEGKQATRTRVLAMLCSSPGLARTRALRSNEGLVNWRHFGKLGGGQGDRQKDEEKDEVLKTEGMIFLASLSGRFESFEESKPGSPLNTKAFDRGTAFETQLLSLLLWGPCNIWGFQPLMQEYP